MKKIIFILLVLSISMNCQSFTVEKINGDVKVLIGYSEEWIKVKEGQILKGSDLIATGDKSYVILNNNGSRFILQSNSALGINNIKKISINELLLALAMEEIRNLPKNKENDTRRNTAVYGEKVGSSSTIKNSLSDLGIKKLNGAKHLVKNGYKESGILLAKETFRKYPDTKSKIEDRLFFVDVMIDIGILNEALTELDDIKEKCSKESQIEKVEERYERIKEILSKK